jgi:hypothetical protein
MTGKYMRPLVLQGLGADSETFAATLRRYDYRTAAFYPPAVFFIDSSRFKGFRARGFDFEHRKVQFSAAADRVQELDAYLNAEHSNQALFVWVHLFEPHEPYEAHAENDFGDRDIDRYDAEVAAADRAIGRLVARMRRARPKTLVIVSADHGEEFSEHGGRYHGTTVYDEQVRVPLIFSAPGLLHPRRVTQPVSLIDVLPTVLAGLDIPISPRLRGHDLGPAMLGRAEAPPDFAFAETDEQTLLAEAAMRLVCLRRIGACQLYDTSTDPGEKVNLASEQPAVLNAMRRRLAQFAESHGHFESERWPPVLRRGIAGDGGAASDIAALLDDVDVDIRRKAAEVLFELARPGTAVHLRRALARDEDQTVRNYAALALTRLGQGAPLSYDLVLADDVRWKHLAALALAEAGDDRGEEALADSLRQACPAVAARSVMQASDISFQRVRRMVAAATQIKSRLAVPVLIRCLRDVRLRAHAARALATIGDARARGPLLQAWSQERYFDTRVEMADALLSLGAGAEMRPALLRFLGTPDPLPQGLAIAAKLDILPLIGGLRERDATRLRRFVRTGVAIPITIPTGGNGNGLRVVALVRSDAAAGGDLRIGLSAAAVASERKEAIPSRAPTLDRETTVVMKVPPGGEFQQVVVTLPAGVSARVAPGDTATFIFYATQDVSVSTLAILPLADELPPPAPR